MPQFMCFLSQYLLRLRQCFQTSTHTPPVLTSSDDLTKAIQQGPIPQHVAFVMDGNRRFAKEHSLSTVISLMQGANVLEKALEFCCSSGVRVVTVYAFSIENFKRPKSQVQSTMEVITSYLNSVARPGGPLERHGVVLRAIGRLDMLDPDVISTIQHTTDLTKNYGDKILNVCISYTARDEIATAIRKTVVDCKMPTDPSQESSALSRRNITIETLTSNMFTADNPPLDLLIRTSGVQRLSDFLLWQCHQDTHIEFLQTLWPDFSDLQLASVIQNWQRGKQNSVRENKVRKVNSQGFCTLVDKTLATTGRARISGLIRTHVKGLDRLPEHLSVILSLQKENDALSGLMDEVAELLSWSASAGIPTLSIYERTGILKSHIPKLYQVVNNKLALYYRPPLQKPGVYVLVPHHDIGYPSPAECGSEKSTSINIMLLSSSDGRETLVDLTKSLADMLQCGELSPNDISLDLIDTKMSEIISQPSQRLLSRDGSDPNSNSLSDASAYLAEDPSSVCSVKPEPDLLFVSGPFVKLDGYPPWQIRLTEIFRDKDSCSRGRREAMKYQTFIGGLSHYAGAEMRFGK